MRPLKQFFFCLQSLIILFFFTIPVLGQNFTVDDAGDQPDDNLGDGVCATAGGVCTLRAAIDQANALGGGYTINFGGAYVIDIDSELEITSSNNTINGDLGTIGDPDIVITTGVITNGFHITGANNKIQGFNLIQFSGTGVPILIDGAGATANTIITNYIGTNLAGDNAGVGTTNFRSLRIINGASGNFIGDGTVNGRNIISGNTFGLEINASDDNEIKGNIIGLDESGALDFGNNDIGIEVISSDGTIIGSALDGRNFIAGNSQEGILLNSSTNCTIVNNYVGVNLNGDATIPNGAARSGIHLENGSSTNQIGDGTADGRNVIGGNGSQGGIFIENSTDITVIGNYIGVGADGSADLGNSGNGISLGNGATNNFIGNGVAGGGNVIAGNNVNEILLGSGPNTVLGNYIGVDATGTAIVNIAPSGIGIATNVNADGNTIGNGTVDGRNIISGNTLGINLQSDNNTVEGNIIGLDVNGTIDLGNGGAGIDVSNSSGNIIGGVDADDYNVISGNGQAGISVNNASGTQILNNRIGTNLSGNSGLGNDWDGIAILGGSTGTQVGNGLTTGRNIISSNGQNGIEINASNFNTIRGNFIGLTLNGLFALGNTVDGIFVTSASTDNTIGGDGSSGEGNVISSNGGRGITINIGSPSNFIYGNIIGLNAPGNTARGNTDAGIFISSDNNEIGDAVSGYGNVISRNSYGIGVFNANGTIIEGNYIGLNAAGTAGQGNVGEGIRISGTSTGTLIGNGATSGINIISTNGGGGINLQGVSNNTIDYNYIGVRANGITAQGNTGNGIYLSSGASSNTFTDNTIANSTLNGIETDGVTTLDNIFSQNSIYNNTGKGINIINSSQNGITPPTISTFLSDGTVTGTSDPGATIEIFFDAADEGQTYVATTSDPGGNWTTTIPLTSFPGAQLNITATQTLSNNTSEFSTNFVIPFLPFVVINTNDTGAGSLRWTMENSNSIAGTDIITFNIPNTDPNYTIIGSDERWTIFPSADLPRITEPATIDASTQPGGGNFRIKIDGQGTLTNGFNVGASSSFYGLYITDFNRGIYDNFGGSIILGDINKGNVINACNVGLSSGTASNHVIKGNFIGTDETGTSAVANTTGISLTTASNVIIGGPLPGEGNVLSGNTNSAIFHNVGSNHHIEGNFIGTNATGTAAIPNGTGLSFGTGGAHTIINNVISGNNNIGIGMNNAGSMIIQGNKIGVGLNGSDPIPNDTGIEGTTFLGGANNTIGGVNAGEENIIAHNINQGVYFRWGNNINNLIIGNSIFANGGKGIDLQGTGNGNKQAPYITDYGTGSVSGTGIDGDVIHLYRDHTAFVPLQGQEYLGTTTVAGGVWTIAEGSILPTDLLNATATDALNNTSEFAINFGEILVYQGPDNTGTQIFDGQAGLVDIGVGPQTVDLDQIFTIENKSSALLTITSVTVSGTAFTIIGAPLSVAANSSENFTLRLSGASIGTFTETVTINSDDANEAVFDFPVTGEIVAFNPFISTWQTTDTQITIPTTGAGFNYDITWTNLTNGGVGDGSIIGVTGNYNITGLANGDIYQIEIIGNFPRIFFANGGDKDKLLTIEQWGSVAWTSMTQSFQGCNNLTIAALDAPNLSAVVDMSFMLSSCNSLTNEDLSSWDVSNVIDMSHTFAFSPNFDGAIDAWDVSNVTSMFGMFWGASSFNQDLNSWTPLMVTDMGRMFQSATAFNGNINGWDLTNLQSSFEMFYLASSFNQDLSGWTLGSLTNMSGMFREAISFNGNITNWDVSSVTDMSNLFLSALSFSQNIDGWNVGNVTTLVSTFQNAQSFNQDLTNWITSNVTNMTWTFRDAILFNGDVTTWDVSSVTTMYGMFQGALVFDQPIGAWGVNTAAVTDMTAMFLVTNNFNQDLSTWDVSSVISMAGMFSSAVAFNGDVTTWVPSSVTNMTETFRDAVAFNQDISGWDVSNVTTTFRMFQGATAFNQDLLFVPGGGNGGGDAWNTSMMNNTAYMFNGATSFNGNITNWNVSNVTDISGMFIATPFNGDISGWDVSTVLLMADVFNQATVFNQDISSWDVSSVTWMRAMFFGASSFDQPIGTWDVSNVTDMLSMFGFATSFNQDLSSWIVSSLGDMRWMFENATSFNQSLATWQIDGTSMLGIFNGATGMSTSNYDATLIGWESQAPSANFLSAPNFTYCNGEAARQSLINNYGWTVVDAGSNCIAPTLQADNLTFSGFTSNQVDINWTSGDGGNRVLLIKEGSAVDATPVDNNTYSADPAYGFGDQLGSGNYVIYNGAGTSMTVTGLTVGNTYHVRIFDYNGPPGNEKYLLTTGLSNPASFILGPEISTYLGTDNSGIEIFNGQVTSIDFGSAQVGNDIDLSFAIENTGNTDLNITSINSDGSKFGEVGSIITPIIPGATETFILRLDGSVDGTFSENITISNNDPDEGSFTFPVTGTITLTPEPEINVFLGSDNTGTPIFDGQASSIDFGSDLQGNDIILTFAIENIGSSDLNISGITVAGTDFSIQTSPTIVAVGTTEIFTVQLSGASAGTFNDIISIQNDDTDEAVFDFPVNGSIVAPEIAVFLGSDNTGTPITDGQASPVDFGSDFQGTDIIRTFAIENIGSAVLNIAGITVAGSDFSILSAPSTVAIGATEIFTVQLSGVSTGVFNDVVTIQNDDSDEASFDFPVTGVINPSLLPEIEVYEGPDNTGTPVISGQASAVDFGTAEIGTDIDFVFTVENTGGTDLNITLFNNTGAEFSLIDGVSAPVPPGGTETFTYRLSGATTGTFNGTVTLTTDDPDEGTFTFPVIGTITGEPEINLFIGLDNTGTPITDGQASSVSFGSEFLGTDISLDFTIENAGSAILNITSVSVGPGPFSIISTSPSIINPGGFGNFTVQLSGASIGTFTTTLTILSDDADEATFDFTISGSINQPLTAEIDIYAGPDNSGVVLTDGQVTSLAFGSSPIGTDIDQVFTIENNGNADLVITGITVSGTNFASTGGIPPPIPAGSSDNFTVRLNGANPGTFSATVSVENNDPDESTFDFPVSGTILAPEIAVYDGMDNSGPVITSGQASAVDIGVEVQGSDLEKVFAVENQGSLELNITSIDVSGTDFTIVSTIPNVLLSGAVESFTIQLSGLNSGTFNETVTILNDDVDENVFEFPVTGIIQAPAILVKNGEDTSSPIVINGQQDPVNLGKTPQFKSLDKVFTIENSGSITLNIISIETDNPLFTVFEAPTTIDPGAFATFTIRMNASFVGVDSTLVTVTSDVGIYTFPVTGEVVDLGENPIVNVYNAVTPNGDGKHDYLKIENIEAYPGNKVIIYTKLGERVFEIDGYDNNDSMRRFEGNSNMADNILLAEGTYYYVIIRENINKNISGFFVLSQ